ncbi:hypothetical protein [Aphanothece sacrum]|uniref:hypothetical protein n=1 Tax=Aphanothece sacrum TaxID=1122 RepID=UPI000F60544E|nr:hypothetical protein [Aphanothece sacrum]GBF87230.1 cysteine desulfuration protein SufE [Aphanothece sacrum FPU3]
MDDCKYSTDSNGKYTSESIKTICQWDNRYYNKLGLLSFRVYDEDNGAWLIITSSLILPQSYLLPNGEIVPLEWMF